MSLLPAPFTEEALQQAVSQQSSRRHQLGGLIARQVEPFINENANHTTIDLGPHSGEARLVLWIARCFLGLGDDKVRVANALIENLAWEPQFHFNSHFCGVAALMLLRAQKKLLSAQASSKLETYVATYLSDWMTDDFRIHGANDNAGIECTTCIALAGDLWGNPALLAKARERLRQPLRMLELRTHLSECNSPTYSAVSLCTLAELAETSVDEEIREMAGQLESHVWDEIFHHFHPVIRHQIGPFSRSFIDDNANQCSLVMMALYSAFGEISPFNPAQMLFPPPPGTIAHNSWLFQWASLACISAATYHPPLDQISLLLNRPIPFNVTGSTEFSPMHAAPGGKSEIWAHVTDDWALSCFGSRPGAGTSVHALYRRHAVRPDASIVEHLASVRSVYTRCHISDGMANFHLRDTPPGEALSEHGAAFSVGKEGTMLTGYVPLVKKEGTRSIRTSVVFPLHHSLPDEIRHGNEKINAFSASFSALDWCFVRDGDIYLAIRPLAVATRGVAFCAQQYGGWENHGLVSVYTMADFSPHNLTDEELRSLGAGFVIEIASRHEWPDFYAFCAAMQEAHLEDRHWGGQREIRYHRGNRHLELIYDYRMLSLRRASDSCPDHLLSDA